MADSMSKLSQWCGTAEVPAPLYDREAVGVESEGSSFTMFCLAEGVKETGGGRDREEAMQEAAGKVLAQLERARARKKSIDLMASLHTRRLSLEEPVSYLAKIAHDQSFEVGWLTHDG
jgi:hypothetical protein